MQKEKSKSEIRNLFHDCASVYISTIEPEVGEAVTVRLRAEKGNVTKAYVEYSTDGVKWLCVPMQLEREDTTGYYEFFAGKIPGQEKMFKYRFRVANELPENEVYYSRTRIGKKPPVFDEKTNTADNCWCMIPGYHAPDWCKGIIWYSAMPDSFYNGDITNDEPISGNNRSNPWNRKNHTLQYKYGGDLKGVEAKLDYIKDLGAEAVFLDPIFKSSQDAGYGPEDYKQIENSFGNRQALEELANAIHEKGLYYMQDVVLMFVANGHHWLNLEETAPYPGASQEWDNPYHDFFRYKGETQDAKGYEAAWGGATLNLANERLKDYLYRDPDSYLQHYCKAPYNIDAIRFDCGGDLSGIAPDGRRVDSIELMGEIRSYLKKLNPNIMLLSEYNMYFGMDTGVWDSRWNLQFVKYALPYIKGEVPESEVAQMIDEEMHNLPRAIALCQYNSMADHDRPRLEGVEPWAYRAYQLIHMTEIGSPCIYYGDEVGNIRASHGEVETFYSMEWNEAVWDYDRYYQTKALTELRKAYPVLRTGAVKTICADDKEHLISFARMDEESIVVTVASRNPDPRSMVIDVRALGSVDGTVFTDWFTGKHYVTANGCIGVDVQPGGTVFVKGEASSTYKGNFVLSAPEEAEHVWMPAQNAFQINRENLYLSKDFFNTGIISAKYTDQQGDGVIYLAAADTADADGIYTQIHGSTVTVTARRGGAVYEVARKRIAEEMTILLIRNEDNTYSVWATEMQNAFNISKEQRENLLKTCEAIAESVQLDLPNRIRAGIGVERGTALFENVAVVYDKDTMLCSDFKAGHSAMFDFTKDMHIDYLADGLVLHPDGKQAEMLTNACPDDWTFKAQYQYQAKNENDFAGIVSRQDDKICVAAGRMMLDGCRKLVFGRATAGEFVVYHTAEDTAPDAAVTIQLQRIGTAYTAVYSYDGTNWKMIGRDIIANMCAERAGLAVYGKTPAVYAYASFGDAIHDGESHSIPYTPIPINTNFAAMRHALIQPSYRIVSGDWRYAEEGYYQASTEAAQMGIHNKLYRGLKVDATYIIDEGEGFVGFEYGKKSYDSPAGDGILFRYTHKREIIIEKQGQILAKTTLSEEYGSEVKLALEHRNGVLVVFAGLDGRPVLVIRDLEEAEGYVAYLTEGVKAHINNYLAASYDPSCYFSGKHETLDFGENYVTKHWPHTEGFINPFGCAVTDFVATAKFRVLAWENDGWIGLAMDAPEGRFEKNASLKVVYNAGNALWLVHGKEFPSVPALAFLKKQSEEHELMLVKKDGILNVYADREQEPCIVFPDFIGNGGTVALYADRAAVTFSDFTLTNLNPTDEPEQADNYQAWFRTK